MKIIFQFLDSEGEFYLELLLFNERVEYITLAELLLILNEEKYKKSLFDFINGFENRNYEVLNKQGAFYKFKGYLDIKSLSIDELNDS